ncbi:AAA family ATPase [Peribacillus sp. SCS-37]|uniref:ATP-binding protein n=1 Tax=Paraperibacillus esterisolvens TaxID=3115296 RepID=UPI003905F223
MKIIELHIYGYGKLENASFSSLSDLQVFFGENEAGKSTLMSFIHSVLFGFPGKNQSAARYEPRQSLKYGGRLVLESAVHGTITVERVKGKASGDVTVTKEGQAAGGEEMLASLLGGLDRASFGSIYSFDLTGLQNLQKMSEQDIGKYLLSAGMMGTDAILTAEARLQKEMDALFKPSGQRPALNVQLKELRQLQGELKKSMDSQKEYAILHADYLNLQQNLEAAERLAAETEETIYMYKEYIRMRPLLREKEFLSAKLEGSREYTFPEDGLERLHELLHSKNHYEAEEAALKAREEEVRRKLDSCTPDFRLLEKAPEIEPLLERLPVLEQREIEQEQLKQKIKQLRQEAEAILRDSGYQKDIGEVLRADTSMLRRESLAELDAKRQQSLHTKEQLEERLKAEGELLEQTEKQLDSMVSQLLPEDERERLQIKFDSHKNTDIHLGRKRMIEEQIEKTEVRYKKLTEEEESRRRRTKNALGAGTAVVLVLAVYALLSKNYSIFGFAFGLAAVGLLIKFLQPSHSILTDLKDELSALRAEAEMLDASRSKPSGWDPSLESLLEKDKELARRIRDKEIQREEQEVSFNRIIDAFENWEKEWAQLEQKTSKEYKGLGYSGPSLHSRQLTFFFDAIQKAKAVLNKADRIQEELQESTAGAEGKIQAINGYAAELGTNHFSWREGTASLKTAIRQAADDFNKWQQIQNQLESLGEALRSLGEKKTFIEREVKTLYRLAQSDGEEEFRGRHKAVQERKADEARLGDIEVQLASFTLSRSAAAEFSSRGITEMDTKKLEDKRKELAEEIGRLLKLAAETEAKIKMLEEGGTHSELLHRFQEKKSAFREEAKKWGEYALAQSLLKRTVSRFMDEKLPRVLKKAESYLSYLTEGSYTAIHMKDESRGVLLQHKSGLMYEASEVSRGTAEQAYTAIRLALALHASQEESFPIIIDDGFVNFDQKRTERVLGLLKELKDEHQIIFFTCHSHIASAFKAGSVITLSPSGAASASGLQDSLPPAGSRL